MSHSYCPVGFFEPNQSAVTSWQRSWMRAAAIQGRRETAATTKKTMKKRMTRREKVSVSAELRSAVTHLTCSFFKASLLLHYLCHVQHVRLSSLLDYIFSCSLRHRSSSCFIMSAMHFSANPKAFKIISLS